MTGDRFDNLLTFLQRLDRAKVPYTLKKDVEDAVDVLVFAPGEYWEVDFLADGEVLIKRFRSDGVIHDESALDELFARWSDPLAVTVANHDDAQARK
jgi:hypothetical protein